MKISNKFKIFMEIQQLRLASFLVLVRILFCLVILLIRLVISAYRAGRAYISSCFDYGDELWYAWQRRKFIQWGLNRYCLYNTDTHWVALVWLIPYRYLRAMIKLKPQIWLIAIMIGLYYPKIYFVLHHESINWDSRTLIRCDPVQVEEFVASIPDLLLKEPFQMPPSPYWWQYLSTTFFCIFYIPFIWFGIDANKHTDWFFRLSWRSKVTGVFPIARNSIPESIYFWVSTLKFCFRWLRYLIFQTVVMLYVWRVLENEIGDHALGLLGIIMVLLWWPALDVKDPLPVGWLVYDTY